MDGQEHRDGRHQQHGRGVAALHGVAHPAHQRADEQDEAAGAEHDGAEQALWGDEVGEPGPPAQAPKAIAASANPMTAVLTSRVSPT